MGYALTSRVPATLDASASTGPAAPAPDVYMPAIGFDMGGTSTDVSRYHSSPPLSTLPVFLLLRRRLGMNKGYFALLLCCAGMRGSSSMCSRRPLPGSPFRAPSWTSTQVGATAVCCVVYAHCSTHYTHTHTL